MGYRLRFEITQRKHAKRIAEKVYKPTAVVPCEHIEAETWLRMADAFKLFAYCSECGFGCEKGITK